MARLGRSLPIRAHLYTVRAAATNVVIALPTVDTPVAAPAPALALGVTLALPVVNVGASAPTIFLGAPALLNLSTVNVSFGVPALSASGALIVTLPTVNAVALMPALTVTILAPHVFRPPTIKLRPADPQGERLWLYYGIDQGISIIKNQDGTYTEQMFPTTDQINAAAFVYMGGHEYVVDDAEYAALVAAGYLGGFPNAQGVYGVGAYGSGRYGN
ncbi:MAG: hypothetical protein KGL35_11220 [Bradyrhizobium sp.]|nr:hypothetical protein [Bradyrhizobium sp.]